MKLIKSGGAVLNQIPLGWENNKRNIIEAIERARAAGVSILCLPEMCISGYGCEDAFHSPSLHLTAMDVLREVVPATRGMVVSIGLPLAHRKALYNAACLAVDGKIVGFVGKRYLAGDGIHYEPRWFKPWPEDLRAEVEVGDVEYPVGDLFFDVGGVRLGFEICEDAWVANRPGSQLAVEGVDVILNPSASHFAFGKYDVRKRFVIEGSRAFGVTYVYTNLLGNEAGRIVYDGGVLIANGGELVAEGPRFSYANVGLTTAVVDIDANRMTQARTGSYRPEVGGDEPIEIDFDYPDLEPVAGKETSPSWQTGNTVKEEEFGRAVALALFDYMRKSRSRGFVVSLSGGADSAAVSCLVALMAELAVGELGVEGVREKLDYLDLPDDFTVRELVEQLLICVYQSTRGDVTRGAARAVAEGIGAEFLELDVDSLVGDYTDMIADAIGRELSWERDDVALQNIQARVRAPSVWMLANIRYALLLATSNRSEAAVGYATMDGDTCGGLSPIAGIDKAFLRHWLRWIETTGHEGASPVPTLIKVNAQQPTAELRPPSAEQTDEGDLMPYEILDFIEGAAIRDKHSPLEVYLELKAEYGDHTAKQLYAYVDRFFKLWCRNQWKRERYAPSFHLDDKNLDPKTWCRFPILSGGYERELAELRAYIERH
jgi:NAD+ synthase (glutamine-hydrolysing)